MRHIKMKIVLVWLLAIPVLAQGEKVLILGDSHSVYSNRFGPAVYNHFKAAGAEVSLVAACGAGLNAYSNGGFSSRCGYWEKNAREDNRVPWREIAPPTKSLQEELRQANMADGLVVIQLGSNHIGNSSGAIRNNARRLLNQLGGNSCVLIGPPFSSCHESELETVNTALAAEAGAKGCTFIDSMELTRDLGTAGDCLHMQPSGSQEWANRVVRELPF